ncbi:MAG: hypothetical protein KC413_06655 [Anaerolineales bacterium]|nr:hypothetical protein [Anaerolineales bacterium]MCA9975410.1 hypothetical protein [Anaerolineales bacterium]
MQGRQQAAFKVHFVVIFAVAILLGACSGGETAVSMPIGATGIPVAAEFAAYYETYGGARVFGYPITEAFQPADNEPLTQYFQMMRLDYDAAQFPGQQVMVYPLGEWAFAGVGEPEPAPVSANGRSQLFPETGYAVQDEFLTFYETYSGTQLFGPPISPQLDEGGLRVQYFRNARLEWRPELPIEQRVQVGLLGQAHFDSVMVFHYRQIYDARPVSLAGITEVDVSAAVKSPILYAGEEQVVYVTVQTLDGRVVPDLSVSVRISYGSQTQVMEIGRTDSDGRIQTSLDLSAVPPGNQVQLHVTVLANDGAPLGTTMLGFRTWW